MSRTIYIVDNDVEEAIQENHWRAPRSTKMTEQATRQLIAPCGMNCGTCVAFFGYTMRGNKRKHPCTGCGSRARPCAFLKKKCPQLLRNQLHYCFECPDFPCETLTTLDTRYRTKYGLSVVENLIYIQKHGIHAFLEREQERWKCPTCSGLVCVHTSKCYTCD